MKNQVISTHFWKCIILRRRVMMNELGGCGKSHRIASLVKATISLFVPLSVHAEDAGNAIIYYSRFATEILANATRNQMR